MVVYREVSGVGITAQTVSEGVTIIVCSAETKNKTQQNKKTNKQTNKKTRSTLILTEHAVLLRAQYRKISKTQNAQKYF